MITEVTLPTTDIIPESASVIGQFIRDCKVEGIHDPDRERWMASRGRSSDVADEDRPHFTLVVSLTDDSVAQLFDDATWLTAYSLL